MYKKQGSFLRILRKTMRTSPEQLELEFQVPCDMLLACEEGRERPTEEMLERLARGYRLPLASLKNMLEDCETVEYETGDIERDMDKIVENLREKLESHGIEIPPELDSIDKQMLKNEVFDAAERFLTRQENIDDLVELRQAYRRYKYFF